MAEEKKTNQDTPMYAKVVGGIIAGLLLVIVVVILVAFIRGLVITLF